MIVAVLLAVAQTAPMSAISAERAFVADAQKLGQWTAFRKWAAPEALMFVPQPIKAHDFLKDRKDPPVSVYWWPGRSYVSCDGTVAINTGTWVRDYGKSVGYFTTVWVKQPDGGWKWVYDAGDELKAPRAEGGDVQPTIAECTGTPTQMPHSSASQDGTIAWTTTILPNGQRSFFAWLWNGEKYENVIEDLFAAPKP